MENNKIYETPVVEIIVIENEDIVTGSGFDPDGIMKYDPDDKWF